MDHGAEPEERGVKQSQTQDNIEATMNGVIVLEAGYVEGAFTTEPDRLPSLIIAHYDGENEPHWTIRIVPTQEVTWEEISDLLNGITDKRFLPTWQDRILKQLAGWAMAGFVLAMILALLRVL